MKKNRNKEKGYGVPSAVAEILNRTRPYVNESKATYSISSSTGELLPQKKPKNNGDTITVSLERMPSDQESNVIKQTEGVIGNVAVVCWIPSHPFYVGQIVLFWENDCFYLFQIRPTEDKKIGEFFYVNFEQAQKYPGRAYRTTKNSKK